ncbi:MAG: ketosteroid isomerase family protein [Cyanobacteria bacterium J06636_16]
MAASTETISRLNEPGAIACIDGICHRTVLAYMDTLNAGDFEALVDLFTPDGSLKPPFEQPVVGKENILSYLRQECQGLQVLPKQGVSEPAADGITQIDVTGKVQVPWLGAGLSVNVAWKFLLSSENKISYVTFRLLASPQELLKLKR